VVRRLVALGLSLAAALAAAGDAARPRLAGQIVFASERGSTIENSELYSVPVDGSRRRALSPNPGGADGGAQWSPDGKLIAYSSDRLEGARHIRGLYVMRADGQGRRRLTPRDLVAPRDFEAPSWSPDGEMLAFSGERGSRRGIWVVRADGTRLRLVASKGFRPRWSPRGNRIAFADLGRIYVVPARGGAVRRLTRGPYDSDPAWSPDGRTIAFVRSDANGGSQVLQIVSGRGGPLRAMSAGIEDMTDLQWSPDGLRILFGASEHLYVVRVRDRARRLLRRGEWPAWSPDGRRIAFTFGAGLYVMKADGRGVKRVRNERGFEFWGGPAWSPDGRTLIYATVRAETDLEIFVVNADGARIRRLTNNSVHDSQPAWSPARRRVAFVRRGVIWLMDADGSGPRRLVTGTEPTWSPSGSQLAYTRSGSVQVVSVRGGGAPSLLVEGRSPAWSPRGTEIAFVRGLRLMALDVRSKAERTVFDGASSCPQRSEASIYAPDWSPDGGRLLYPIACDEGRFFWVSAHTVQPDGGGHATLKLDNLAPSRLAWSPDGSRVAFVAENGTVRIATAKLDGTGRTTVVRDTAGAAYLDLDW
jgi:Tol biopolymer transport system component